MKVSLSWMRDYAPLDAPLATLRQALVDTGTEVDSMRRDAQGTIVARVVALTPVPESTRKPLQFVDLDTGDGNTARLLTAATNLHTGDMVPYAPPGTLLPGWDEPLGVRRMLGRYDSPGMLLSDKELALGETGDGIRILDHGVPGHPVEEVLALDAVLEVDVTTNRPDCLCHAGVARELAAALHEPFTEPPGGIAEVLLSAGAIGGRVEVDIQDSVGCPRFAVRVIENVAVGPSPWWLQARLRAVGLRPINNVVDVTNYVALEQGQPLHAFDLDRFRAVAQPAPRPRQPVRVRVRRAHSEERVLCLDGAVRSLDGGDLVVCADEVAVSVAGVMGGAATAVDGTTRAVLVEAASWDARSIRATSRRLGLRTEASVRFEKGLSDALPIPALDRASALIAELGHGHVLRDRVDEHPGPLPVIPAIRVPVSVVSGVLGYDVDPSEAATALARLGFEVEQDHAALLVTPPDRRRDVRIPVDVVEEIGRSLGYARVPETLPGRRVPVEAPAPRPLIEDGVRDLCCAAGLDEAITWAFTSAAAQEALRELAGNRRPLPLRNPLTADWAVMRVSLLPGLCAALATNQNRGVEDPALFEVGRAFWEGERIGLAEGSLPDGVDLGLPPLPAEPLLLGIVSQASHGGAEESEVALRHLQSVLASLGHELGGIDVTIGPAEMAGLRPGRAGVVRADGVLVGVIGELAAATAAVLELRGRVVVAEVDLGKLLPAAPRTPRFLATPRFPPVDRDLAVTVPVAARAGDALAAARRAGGDLLETVVLDDEYRGGGIPDGRKSWTFRMVMRAADRTLTGEEATAVHTAVARALVTEMAAEVRR